MRSKIVRLAGWGRFPVGTGPAFRPERIGEVRACLSASGESLLARGAGRSYGDQALNSAGSVILMERLDRLLHFLDADDSLLEVEAGVRLGTIQNWLLPRGFMLPVTPGTGFVSVGGAIANDVHGKNHDADGSFGRHVAWIELLCADGRTELLTPEGTPREFWATVGGGGLTGIILAAGLKLLPVPGGAVYLCEQPMPDLAAFLNGLRAARQTSRFSVGWIDALARGDRLGRGILETADLSSEPFPCPRDPKNRRIPLDVPSFCLSQPAVRLFNWGYYHRIPRFGRHRLRAIRDFLYPLDRIHDWNRLYGKSGFSQFQALLPEESAESGLRALLTTVSKGGAASFLAVLKTLGAEGSGLLSFPGPGFTLALDLPRRGDTSKVLARLEAITLDHNGRVYLAKDSALSADAFTRMYPRLSEFQSVAAKMDPLGRFSSDQARRLGIR